MEDKTSRLNNLMNCKVNMDFIKNINLPSITIPKIKSRKVFSAKTSSNQDTNQPPQVSTSVVSHSPSGISTISSLLHDASEPDYDQENPRFGRLKVPRSTVDLTSHDEEILKGPNRDESTSKPLTLQAKLTKQYKELSEFKFKHILTKKTVVKTTDININDFTFRPDDLTSERSDYDFEIHSLPDAELGPDGLLIEQDDYVRPHGPPMDIGERQASYESHDSFEESPSLPSLPPPTHQPPPPPPPQRIQRRNVEASSDMQPNKSSLFKQVKTMSIKRISDFTEKSDKHEKYITEETPSEPSEDITRKSGISKMSFNRQSFEEACNKAKTKMTNQIQKLKTLQSRKQNPDNATRTHDTEARKSEPDVIFPRISYGAEDGGFIRSIPTQDGSRPSSRVDLPIGHSRFLQKQDSLESQENDTRYVTSTENTYESTFNRDRSFVTNPSEEDNYGYTRRDTPVQNFPPKRSMQITSQNSWEENGRDHSQQNISVSRPAPPVPSPKPSSFHSLSFDRPSKMDLIRKRFSQRRDDSLTNNASLHVNASSEDSDSWIPDIFKGPAQNQINLCVIEEAEGAWSTRPTTKRTLRNEASVDIFRPNLDEPFDDFDEALRHAPTVAVVVPKMSTHIIRQSKEKPGPVIIQQALVVKPDEPFLEENNENRSKHFNKLLSQFQRQTGGSEESTDSINEGFGNHFDAISMSYLKNDTMVGRRISPISYPEIIVENSGLDRITESPRITETVPAKPIVRVASTKRIVCNQETAEEAEIEEDSFHSLDYDDGVICVETKPVIQRRIVRLVYTAEV